MTGIPVSALLATMSPQRLRDLFARDAHAAAGWIRLTALDGVAEGQLCYGRMLLAGTSVLQDARAAFNWFRRAADQSHVEATNMVGRCHDMGWGTPEDPQAAAVCFQQAAAAGHAWAQYNLGHLYLDGRGLPADAARAYHWYLTAAEQGHERAMNLVGRCCEQGWGRPRDIEAAADWYRRSAAGGYFRGQFNWATHLVETCRDDEAAVWFERAAQSGTPEVRRAVGAAVTSALLRRPDSPALLQLQERLRTFSVTGPR